MPNLKDIRKRIVSVRNTEKITKAMKMVAASKLRRAQTAVVATRPYVAKLIEIIAHLVTRIDPEMHPLLRVPEAAKRCVLVVVSADRGLCGAYNANVYKAAMRFVAERGGSYERIETVVIGRKGYEALRRRGHADLVHLPGVWTRRASSVAYEMAHGLSERFVTGEVEEVFLLYTRFRSAIAQQVVLDKVLPLRSVLTRVLPEEEAHPLVLTPDEGAVSAEAWEEGWGDYLYEPSTDALLAALLPRAVSVQILRALLESVASEHGARMTAMDNATKNASEMIASLTLQYNRARQAAITKELIEIVSGAGVA